MNRIVITVTGPKGSSTQAVADMLLHSVRSMGFQAGIEQHASPGTLTSLPKIVMDSIIAIESHDDAPAQQELDLVSPPAPKSE